MKSWTWPVAGAAVLPLLCGACATLPNAAAIPPQRQGEVAGSRAAGEMASDRSRPDSSTGETVQRLPRVDTQSNLWQPREDLLSPPSGLGEQIGHFSRWEASSVDDLGAIVRLPPVEDSPAAGGRLELIGVNLRSKAHELPSKVWLDHKGFYSSPFLGMFAAGIGVHGLMANTPIDQEIHDWYQHSVRSPATDDWSSFWKTFGDGTIFIPAFAGLTIAGAVFDDCEVGHTAFEFGNRVLRAYLVGAPPMLTLQYVLGASRPTEGDLDESHWFLFHDVNGVSGHAFMGAVPFITAARMVENPWAKAGLYFCSALPGWTRVNDSDHYASQSLLGWWIAYLACKVVADSDRQFDGVTLFPVVTPQMTGFGAEVRW